MPRDKGQRLADELSARQDVRRIRKALATHAGDGARATVRDFLYNMVDTPAPPARCPASEG